MTVQLNWPPDVVNRLTGEAQQNGLSLDAYLLKAVLRRNLSGPSGNEAESQSRKSEAGARILEIQGRVKLDPDGLTSRDYIYIGRR